MTTVPGRLGAPGRFLLSGALNTAASYGLYVVLLTAIDYRLAYTAAFIFGIGFGYVLNRSFVFRTGGGVTSMALLTLAYVLQYAVSLAIVVLWTEILRLPAALGLLPAIMITVPMTFVLARWIFVKRHEVRPRRPDTPT